MGDVSTVVLWLDGNSLFFFKLANGTTMLLKGHTDSKSSRASYRPQTHFNLPAVGVTLHCRGGNDCSSVELSWRGRADE